MLKIVRIYNYSFILVALFPIMGLKIGGFVVGFWVLLSIIVLIDEKLYKSINKKQYYKITILSALYLAYLLNFLFTFDLILVKKLETCLSILIFPLFMFLNRDVIKKETLNNSLIAFFISNFILAIITWGRIINKGFLTMLDKNDYYYPVFRNTFYETTSIHLPYLGLFFAFSIFIGFYFITQKSKIKTVIVLIIFACILLLVSILFFSARMALISILIGFTYWLYKTIKNKILFTRLAIGVIGVIAILIIVSPLKERVNEVLTSKIELPSQEMNNESKQVNFRYAIYYCSFKIFKKHWLLGVGKHNVQRRLDVCYADFNYSNYDDFTNKKYNTHNQYIDIILSFGILGGLILISTLFYGFSTSNSLIYTIFLLFIFMSLLTENILDRQVGVIFFSFFNAIFFINKDT